jgi:hypothetical protein
VLERAEEFKFQNTINSESDNSIDNFDGTQLDPFKKMPNSKYFLFMKYIC